MNGKNLKQEYRDSSVSYKNVGKNTPPIIKSIGNALIIIGLASGAVTILFNPAVGAVITLVGTIGKIITMFFADKNQ